MLGLGSGISLALGGRLSNGFKFRVSVRVIVMDLFG